MKKDLNNISEKIIKAILKLSNININEILPFLYGGEIVEYKKNIILKKQNQAESHIRIIISGVGGYFNEINNIEKCIYFDFENDWFFDYISFFHNTETDIFLKTMTPTRMFILSKKKFLELSNQHPSIIKLQLAGIELLYKETQDTYFDLLSLNAAERYIKLIKTRKDILQNVDHKYIASFLGITPQSLSRLRKNIKL
ncbi:MAG: Crp/Fnr family transcriptional regulator [Bacteroidales bacterium]|nr:Crp/Fnr family transcriptional regulator [Bacteroidales bacterium]